MVIVSNVQLSVKKSLSEFVKLPYSHHYKMLDDVTVYQSYMRGIPKCFRLNAKRWIRIVKKMFDEYVAENGKPDIIHAHCCKWAGYAAMQLSEGLWHTIYYYGTSLKDDLRTGVRAWI